MSKRFKREKTSDTMPILRFRPADEDQFKIELLRTHKAYFTLTYDTGIVDHKDWNASHFTEASGLRHNIFSKTFWRTKDEDGLVDVLVEIVK